MLDKLDRIQKLVDKCVVLIEYTGCADGLLPTLDSIMGQTVDCRLELVLLADNLHEIEDMIRSERRKHPWLPLIGFVSSENKDPEQHALVANNADYLLRVACGDELLPDALDRLLTTARKHRGSIVLGACRATNLETTWAPSGIDAFFEYPEVLSPSVARSLVAQPELYAALLPLEYFQERSSLSLGSPTVVLHDYVMRRFSDGPSPTDAIYEIKRSKLSRSESILDAPFPGSILDVKKKKAGAWIFGERQGMSLDDSAWVLFQYCRNECPDLESYFVINSAIADQVPPEYRDATLIKGSEELKKTIGNASHIIFTDSAADILDSVIGAYSLPDLNFIYLTHGYLGYFPGVYQRDHQYIDYVLCTSNEDIVAASEEWSFPVSKFIKTGLPRWDRLDDNHGSCRTEVLFCPTWRKTFESEHWQSRHKTDEPALASFQQSKYYRSIAAMLSSPTLVDLLKSEEITIVVKLHFRLMPYLKAFSHLENSHVVIATPETDPRPISRMLEDAVMLITDYSSIMWDMAYMGKPVICFQHDKASILGERCREQYDISDLELPFRFCHTAEELLGSLHACIKSDFQLLSTELSALDRFLPIRDKDNCQRAFRTIQNNTGILVDRYNMSSSKSEEECREATLITESHLFARGEPTLPTGVIGPNSLSLPHGYIALEPNGWREKIISGNLSALIIEPFPAASSQWSEFFFSLRKTQHLLQEMHDLTKANNVETELFLTPSLPNKERVKTLGRYFDSVTGTTENSLDSKFYFDVSVVIPTYNNEDYIHRSIDSVLNQRFNGSIEILVIDDGSIDGTPELLHDLSKNYPNIRVIRQENMKQGAARNYGILAARGQYISFLDADDMLPRDAIAELHFSAQKNHTNVAIGIGASCDPQGHNKRVNQSWFHYSKAPEIVLTENWRHIFYDPSCVGKLYLREFLIQNSIFFPHSFHEDLVFCFSLFSKNVPMSVVRKVVYFYIGRPKGSDVSGTQTFSIEKFRQMMLAGNLAFETVCTAGLKTRVEHHALGFLMLRYDRFLWKKRAADSHQEGTALSAMLPGLYEIIEAADDLLIVDSCRYFPALFLAVKRQQFDVAEAIYLRGEDGTLELNEYKALLPLDLLASRREELSTGGQYDYFTPQVMDGLERSELITDMAYGYRLGSVFVEGFKSPASCLRAPFDLSILAFDMLSGRGRKKQQRAAESLLAQSKQALESHSRIIQSTAAYRLGVALMEAVTASPPELLALPVRIRSIYGQTKPL